MEEITRELTPLDGESIAPVDSDYGPDPTSIRKITVHTSRRFYQTTFYTVDEFGITFHEAKTYMRVFVSWAHVVDIETEEK